MSFGGTSLLLNNRCIIQRYTSTPNAYGESVKDWQPLAISVRCRLLNAKGKQLQVDNQAVIAEFLLMLPFEQDIKESDRVVINSLTYDVLFVDPNPGNSNHHSECFLKLVRSAS